MGSSSFEDDEFRKRLREVVKVSVLDLKTTKATGVTANGDTSSKPSLRYNPNEDSDDGGDSVSTAGFKAHMSKKLSSFLDGTIVEVNVPSVVDAARSEDVQWSGLKLFSSSDGGRVKTSREVERERDEAQRHQKRRCPSVSSGSEDDEEEVSRLASAAVSGFDIVQKGEITTCSSAAVSSVPLSERTGKESRELVASTRDGNATCSLAGEEVPKKKKRKRKKSKPSESIESVPSLSSASDGNSEAEETKKKKKDAEPKEEVKEEEPQKHKQKKKKKHKVHEES